MSKHEKKSEGKRKRRVGGKIKQAKYCRLMVYINDRDPTLGEVIDRLCIAGDLTPRRENGVTLLYPKDPKYREEIVDAMNKGDEEGALKMIRSLIIPDYVKSLSELSKKTIGNRLGNKLDVDKASEKSATIKPDVELEPSDFKWLKKYDKQEQNLNVFFIVKGRVPTKGEEKYMAPLRQRRVGPKDMGKKIGGHNPMHKERMINGLIHSLSSGYSSCVNYVTTILKIVEAKDPAKYRAILPLLNWEPIVTLIALANLDVGSLLYDDVRWDGSVIPLGSGEYANMLETVTSDTTKFQKSVDLVRSNITRNASAVEISKKITEHYEELVTKNSISGVGKVYPDETLNLLGSDKVSKKKWLDEMAFNVGAAINVIRMTTRGMETVNEIKNFLQNYVYGICPGSNYAAELTFTNVNFLVNKVERSQDFDNIKRFVNSSAFMHLLYPLKLAGEEGGDFISAVSSKWNLEADSVRMIQESKSRQSENVVMDIILKMQRPQAVTTSTV